MTGVEASLAEYIDALRCAALIVIVGGLVWMLSTQLARIERKLDDVTRFMGVPEDEDDDVGWRWPWR